MSTRLPNPLPNAHPLPIASALRSLETALVGPPAEPVQLQVGDLAKRSGKTVRALHLYEELGLLRPLGRSKGRYRLYGEDALVRIRWIGKLQDLGLSLHEIRALAQEAEAVAVAPQVAERMRGIYEQKLQDTREQLQKLKELEAELQTALTYLEECSSLCAPVRTVHECRSCQLRSGEGDGGSGSGGCPGSSTTLHTDIPDLVRGYQLTSSPNLSGEHLSGDLFPANATTK